MIEIYEGRLGGGKTYYAVRRMMEYMAAGGHVSSNIHLKWDKVCEYVLKKYSWQLVPEQYLFLDDDKINLFHRYTPCGSFEQPSLVVIDEAHIWLNSRDWSQQDRELLTFLTQSRHCFTDIIFISQAALNCDKQIMRLVQYIWRFRDMKKYRIAGIGIGWPLNQFLRVQFDQDGTTALDSIFEWKEKAVYELYDSFVLYRKFPRLEGLKVKFDGKVKKKGGWMKIIIILLVLGGLMSVWTWSKWSKNTGTVWKKHSLADLSGGSKIAEKREIKKKEIKSDLVSYDHFLGVIEDERGRVVFGDKETYQAGGLCELGKVVSVKDEMIVVSGFDGRPHMIKKKNFTSDELYKNIPVVRDDNATAYEKVAVASGAGMASGRQGSLEIPSFDVTQGIITRNK